MSARDEVMQVLRRLGPGQWISVQAIAHELAMPREDVAVELGQMSQDILCRKNPCCITGLDRLCYRLKDGGAR